LLLLRQQAFRGFLKHAMKKILFLLMLLALGSSQAALAFEWREEKGEHFIIYYVGDKNFAQEALNTCEIYYRRIASDLGYPRHSDFWTWEKRVKIYIYADRGSYLAASGEPSWSSGMADYSKKEILTYAWSENFLTSLLPHEIAHLIFRDFIGFKGNIPLWIDEGVAQWTEEAIRSELHKKTKELYEKNSLLSIRDITLIDIRTIGDLKQNLFFRRTRTKDNKTGILILSPDVLVNTYYIQSGSLIGFLIEKYGTSSFTEFCRRMRDGRNVEEALATSYPEHIRSLEELEDEWRKYLRNM
jgi:hypothetical protein